MIIGYSEDDIPFQSRITYPMIRWIRLSKNLTQEQFGQACRIDQSVLTRIETGEIDLSLNYESRILKGCKRLNISDHTIQSIKELVQQTGE
ncbi:helix-turn-helix domain-containing protein [Oceanobacillus sp. 143]|uniref:XRE family transcriptional regulator n=1 Tax=Oceanobacillus zhaokaii TaxID=2052660 RepID=A0A345PDS8_9BACI|nr:helix-turn-helix transcriptional regulator [Oceanobacillus zhaokaii]AXI08158.1 XRE family transcriptional regulator [Oceanobacillus zhaokaii]QGS68106.1 helix-turn-helix domain-containing protein [Oceanobacillus sp. 143]